MNNRMMYIAMGAVGLFLIILIMNSVLSFMLLRKLGQSNYPSNQSRVSRLAERRLKKEPEEQVLSSSSDADESNESKEKPVPVPVKRKSRLGLRQ